MAEFFIGNGEGKKDQIFQKVSFTCRKIFANGDFSLVEVFAFGGSFADGRWGKKPNEDIDTDICVSRLPKNGDQQKICREIVDIFLQDGIQLDIRFITDRKGNHAVFIEDKPPGPENPLELMVDFSRKNLIQLYQKEYPGSFYIARNKEVARFWCLPGRSGKWPN